MNFIFKKVTDVASTPFFKMYSTADTLRRNIAKCFEQLFLGKCYCLMFSLKYLRISLIKFDKFPFPETFRKT